ncbi:AAA family ATPase [Mesorhizobium sp. M1A.F.Ca.IN.020.06.1.1]|uniref:AAA family ATPase n=4 Tax=Mesorhizobium TaxID=68287 RepID=UPI000FD1F182|nr:MULTISPECIES: AAA family ATPase [unclassified Mesorhizobium]RUW24396.1 AAA family ATPase [Mesorhizobium sp. M1A.F.Ca.IN.020.06.1.1]RWF81352.1 MAG: AAA family ATPase [Mesorhizobium sp.]RWF93167.1 MAG: AAA family ATPase [Mesorhizobium sp.]RWG75733.1 MAG: AAA family ATPase [Mesorhizobium sp.]TIN64212.1 MAG: AAA family ATPase [Mesorhizobium sp.]
MTVAPTIQSFDEFEAATVEALKPPFRSKFGLIRWEDQNARSARPYEFQVQDLLPRRETVLWFGESQSGKSFSAFDAGIHVAAGMAYQGRRTLRGGVVYCCVEKGHGARNRMQAFRQFYDLPIEDFPFAVTTRRFDIFSEESTVDELAAECIEIAKKWSYSLDVVVIDTHDKATPGASEIDKKDVSTILKRYERLRDLTGAAVWVIGHSNSFGSARGSLVLYNAIETVISISVMKDKQLGEFRDANNRVIRQAKVMKQSEGEAGFSWKFVLPAVEIDRNDYGEPVTSCVVTPPAKEEGEVVDKGFKPTTNDSMFLKALLAALTDKGQPPSPMLALPPSITRVVDYEHVKEAFKNLNPDDGEDLANWRDRLKKALRRGRERLLDHRIIGVNSPFIWITGKPVRGIIRPKTNAPSQTEKSAGMDEVMASEGDIQL